MPSSLPVIGVCVRELDLFCISCRAEAICFLAGLGGAFACKAQPSHPLLPKVTRV